MLGSLSPISTQGIWKKLDRACATQADDDDFWRWFVKLRQSFCCHSAQPEEGRHSDFCCCRARQDMGQRTGRSKVESHPGSSFFSALGAHGPGAAGWQASEVSWGKNIQTTHVAREDWEKGATRLSHPWTNRKMPGLPTAPELALCLAEDVLMLAFYQQPFHGKTIRSLAISLTYRWLFLHKTTNWDTELIWSGC